MIKLTNQQYKALEIVQSMKKENLDEFLKVNETLGIEQALKKIAKSLNTEKKAKEQ